MTIFLIILLILAAIIALLLLAGLFITKDYHIERSVIILQPKEKAFEYIKMLKNQDDYNTWWMNDPKTRKTFIGADGTVGFVAQWDNGGSQKGEQEIVKINEGQRIDFELRFEKPFKNIADTCMTTETVGEGTKVSWIFSGKNFYPMNAIFKVFNLEKKLGEDLSVSLNRLKKVLENKEQ